jgi:branched-chain amino acid transport system substrate-binding protein
MQSSGTKATCRPWRVGVLFSRTGPMAIIEETQLRGTLLAIEEINQNGGIDGRELVPTIYDPESEDELYAHLARKMLTEDGITNIFGCYRSSSRKAVLPIVERLNGLLWYPTLYEGFEYSPNVIYTGAAPNQNSVELCDYLIEKVGGRFYFIGSDYIYPRQSNRIMRNLLHRRGGEVVGETYIKLNARHDDFIPVIARIKALRPDVIFSTVVGEATVSLYQVYADMGLDPRRMPIASLTTTETEIRAMGSDVGEGHITSAPYFQSLDGPNNRMFVEKFKKHFGYDEPTNMCAEAAYFQVQMFAQALGVAYSMDTDLLRDLALAQTIEAPQGPVSIHPEYGQANLWSRIGRVTRLGQFEILRQSAAAVDADPYMTEFSYS